MTTVFVLLVAFQLKHFLCDYPLQRPWMLNKFHADSRVWVPALLGHSLVHSLGTWAIIGATLAAQDRLHTQADWWVPLLMFADLAAHFVIDRLKASPRLGGRWKPTQPAFWWALGADQMGHHLTHYFIIWAVLR